MKNSGFPTRSLEFVKAIAKEKRIKLAIFDKYLCQTCWQGYHPEDTTTFPPKKRKKLLQNFLEHRQLVDHLSNLYHQFKEKALGSELEVLIIFDYTRFHETADVKVHDLGIVLICKDGIFYYDYVASAPHKYDYTVTAMRMFFKTVYPRIKCARLIRIMSDGGLRTKENLYFFSLVQADLGIAIEVHIFAPQHGHSLADTHFGVVKSDLKIEYAGRCIATIADIVRRFEVLPDTTVTVIDSIPTINWSVAPVESIRSYHAFCFPAKGVIACWRFYNDCPPDYWQEFDLLAGDERIAQIEIEAEEDYGQENRVELSEDEVLKEANRVVAEVSIEEVMQDLQQNDLMVDIVDLTNEDDSKEDKGEVSIPEEWVRRILYPRERLTDSIVEEYFYKTLDFDYGVEWWNKHPLLEDRSLPPTMESFRQLSSLS